MKKTWFGVLAAVLIVVMAAAPVYAEHYEGGSGWTVSFTGERMESSFRTADLNDAIYDLQPGDSIDLTLTLKNSGDMDTDWWMKNKVLRSLEDTQRVAAGGGYTYILSYQGPGGVSETLYSSDTVGGEKNQAAGEGLHEATNSMEEYFFLDTLAPGAQAYIRLTVALDGETQGNAYQDTLADLEMNFAVEKAVAAPVPSVVRNETAPNRVRSDAPRTGDENRLFTAVIVALVSGLLFLLLFVYSIRRDRRERREAGGTQTARVTLKLIPVSVALAAGLLSPKTCTAQEQTGYTYTVTFYAGEQGTISSSGISVDGGGNYETVCDGKTVRITGLTSANHIRFQNSAVTLGEDSRYYVRGVRMGGRDNSTVDLSYFPVERDQDYVIAYGIQGDLVRYTVSFVDENGAALLPSQDYYGNVGDKPVIACLYVEGYQPQAYNLTRTLQSDAVKNQFTFVYHAVAAGGQGGDGGQAGGANQTGAADQAGAGGQAGDAGQAGAGGAAGAEAGGAGDQAGTGTGGQAGDAGQAGAGTDGQAGAAGADQAGAGPGGQAGADGAGTDAEDGGEPPELINIDDQEVPLANPNAGNDGTVAAARQTKQMQMLVAAAVGAAAAAGIGVSLFLFLRRRRGKGGGNAGC